MKRIFNIIASVAALALVAGACTDDVFEKAESSTTPLAAGTVEISISNITDESFDVTLTPTSASAYYSYLVDNDEYYDGLSAASLYAVGYSSVAQGTVKYADNSSYTFTVAAEPNTVYTVYAVCASVEGNVGTITYTNATTTDGVAPEIDVESFETLGNKIALPFSENVKYVEGKTITATVYSLAELYSLTSEPTALANKPVFAPRKEIEEEEPVTYEGTVQVSNGVAVITFEGITQPGAFYVVNFEDGTFEDYAGNPCPGITSAFEGLDEDLEPVAAEGSVWGHIDNEAFEFSVEETFPTSVTDPKAMFTINSEFDIFDFTKEGVEATVISSAAGKTSTYTLAYGSSFAIVGPNVVGMMVPEALNPGEKVTFTIAADSFMDAYGNTNAEFTTPSVLMSYGYTIEDVVGTYNVTAYPLTNGSSSEMNIIIEESDNADYDVAITYLNGFTFKTPVYGTFDTDLGLLSFAPNQIFGSNNSYNFGLCVYNSTANIEFNVPAAGVISINPDQYLVWGAYDKTSGSYLGYFYVWADIYGERAEEELGEGSIPAGVAEKTTFFTEPLKK